MLAEHAVGHGLGKHPYAWPGGLQALLPRVPLRQRALQYLRDRGVLISRFRDVKAEPLQRSEVEELARKVGGPGKLFSRRAMKYR